MKLKKREITLNEKDSIRDVFYLEKNIVRAYGVGGTLAFKRETVNEVESLHKEAVADMDEVQRLLEKAE